MKKGTPIAEGDGRAIVNAVKAIPKMSPFSTSKSEVHLGGILRHPP